MEQYNSELKAIKEYLKNIPRIRKKIDDMDKEMGERMERMEDNVEIIKMSLKRKVDTEEFEALEKRVMLLERKA